MTASLLDQGAAIADPRIRGVEPFQRQYFAAIAVAPQTLGTMGDLSATLHMMVGLPCAGKSTYATALEKDTNAVLVSLDRWLITLFGRYSIGEIGHQEHVRRVLSTRALIWESSSEHLRRSVDVILDDGFFLREHRRRHIELATALGAASTIHFIDAPVNVLRSRISARNAYLPVHNFHIDPEMLDVFVRMFERPSNDEGAALINRNFVV